MLERLREAVRGLEGRGLRSLDRRGVSTGWKEVDAALGSRYVAAGCLGARDIGARDVGTGPLGAGVLGTGPLRTAGLLAAEQAGSQGGTCGLERGALHEWVGPWRSDLQKTWCPPLTVLAHMAQRAWAPGVEHVVWVGPRESWPYGHVIERSRLQRRYVCVAPATVADTIWVSEQALRSRAVAAVVVMGDALDMRALRRLQLATEDGGGLGLIARAPWQRHTPSVAATRWALTPQPTAGSAPCWRLELLRCQGGAHWNQVWTLRWQVGQGVVALSSMVASRLRTAQRCVQSGGQRKSA